MLQRLRDIWPWHEIRGCPGRFIVSKQGDDIPPERVLQLIQADLSLVRQHHFVRVDKDDVFVAVFLDASGGGLITFCKNGSKFVHTLNEPEGLARKLNGLGYYHMLEEDSSKVNKAKGLDQSGRLLNGTSL